MILATLKQIEEYKPCDDFKILENYLNIPTDEEFCISRFFEVTGTLHSNVENCIWFLCQTGKPKHRRIANEFAYWCIASNRHHMKDKGALHCLDTVRQCLDGDADISRLKLIQKYAFVTGACSMLITMLDALLYDSFVCTSIQHISKYALFLGIAEELQVEKLLHYINLEQ